MSSKQPETVNPSENLSGSSLAGISVLGFGAVHPDFTFDDVTLAEIPVSIAGRRYLLREATAEVAIKLRNFQMRSTKFGRDGKAISMEGMADGDPYLLSMCLFSLDGPEGQETVGAPVHIQTIKGWPNRVQEKLSDKVKEMSGLQTRDTIPSLRKQIRDLQERLDDLIEEENRTREEARQNGQEVDDRESPGFGGTEGN